jgi:hypothetical protein
MMSVTGHGDNQTMVAVNGVQTTDEGADMVPYAGIAGVHSVAFGVDETRRRVHRLLYTERHLVHVIAGWLCNAHSIEIKGALALHLWQDAEHLYSLAERGTQLRAGEKALAKNPDERLQAALAVSLDAADEVLFLAGVYRVIKPALAAAYRRHLQETHPLADHPTVRLLRLTLPEEEVQIRFVEGALAELLDTPERRAEANTWEGHLRAWLASAGGILGDEPLSEVPRDAGAVPFHLATVPPREEGRFREVMEPKGTIEEKERMGRARWDLMVVRLQELMAAEHPASVIFEREDMPAEFYRDLARHTWDEMRHCMFGIAALDAEGIPLKSLACAIGDQKWCMEHSPAERYTWLALHIEHSAMKYPPGAREEYEYARDTAKHPLLTQYLDFDWADEVLHAQLGRKWSPPLLGPNVTLDQARDVAERLGREFWDEYVSSWRQRGYTW